MQRFSWRGRKARPEQDTQQTSLSNAKIDAWARAAGGRQPPARPPAPPRRHHPGLLHDLPFPEGPVRPRRGFLRPALVALARAIGMGGLPEGGSSPPASASAAEGASLARLVPGQAGARGEAARAPAAIVVESRLSSAA
jgi:hypothetical protein